MAERMSFHVFKYGFLLFAIQAFLQTDTRALRMLAGGTALAYIMYTSGGLVAQRFTGELRAMIIAVVLLPFGNALVAWEAWRNAGDVMTGTAFTGLGMALAGTGLFRINSVAVTSKTFPANNAARQAAFQTLFWAESCGAIIAVVLVTFVAVAAGWPATYATTALLCAIAAAMTFSGVGRHWSRVDNDLTVEEFRGVPVNLSMVAIAVGISILGGAFFRAYNHLGWVTVIVVALGGLYVIRQYRTMPSTHDPNVSLSNLAMLTVVILVFGFFVEQGVSAMVLFSKYYVDLALVTPFGTLVLAPNVFLILSCVSVIVGTPIVTGAILTLAKRGVPVPPGVLISIGVAIISLSFFLIAFAAWLPRDGLAGAGWMVAVYVLGALAELFLFPAAFSLVTQSIPPHRVNAIIGIWFLSFAVSGFIAHRAAAYVSMNDAGVAPTAHEFVEYFIFLGAAGFVFVALFEAFRSSLKRGGKSRL